MANHQQTDLFARDLKHLGDLRAQTRRRRRCAVGAGLGGLALVLAVWLGGQTIASEDRDNPASQPIVAPDVSAPTATLVALSGTPAISPELEIPHTEPELQWHTHRIRRGDTLAKIFRAAGIAPQQTARIAKQLPRELVRGLQPGRDLEIGVDSEGQPRALEFDLNDRAVLKIDVNGDEVNVVEQARELDIKHRFTAGVIHSSLFQAGSRAGLTDRQILEVAAIFGWDVDFALDLRRGDRFIVAYEELFAPDGKRIGNGDIVAAEFVNRGAVYRAVRHVYDDGHVDYFSPEGASVQGTFLRTPVQFSRITSGFKKRRFHPILKKWRSHRGVDYGAPGGTPVLATADGRVRFVGRKGGYGKTIILRHGGAYSTLYGHLARYKRGVRRGATVKQGDVLGYVGSTGLATGPHLHYEFRVNGTHRNPLTYRFPKRGGIEDQFRAAFVAQAQDWIDRLAAHANTLLAQK